MKKLAFVTIIFTAILISFAAQKKPVQKSKVPDKATMERGKKVYDVFCLACHQADGTGVPQMNPPLVKTKWVLGDKKTLINIVLNGMDEAIEVDGEMYHNTMPAHGHLSDQQVADVLTFVRNSFSNKATAIGVNEVKALRSTAK